MSIFKCKMCGGTIEIQNNESIGVCEYCGTKQTLPKTSDDVITNLFNRANNLRLKCEFDKAAAIYEKIVEQDMSEAEAHWGIVLCKYGIEYVEDPKTMNRIPTCHRTLFEAVTTDADYLSAIEHADGAQREVYESEAAAIDRIQKDILAIVKDEKPFDVFICYKETDESGKRTIDSTIANDIYYQLTGEGFKVFYAAITLEDKLGKEYEPYIFAALNSAKVMVVLGTKPEHFDAVWVKNEWSRFLHLMKSDRSKLLIPCYRNMDAYDLPEEFSHLQSQDMSKIGFINDLVRGIKKVVSVDEPKATVKETVVVNGGGVNTSALLKRAFMSLEDGEWQKADDFCEQVLNLEPENADAYLGKLMAELKVRTREGLKDLAEPFDSKNNFQKAVKFGDNKLADELREYAEYVNDINENTIKESIYNSARAMILETELDCEEAIEKLEQIQGYKDADELLAKCKERLQEIRAKNEAKRQSEKLENERRAEIARIEAEKRKKKIKKIAAIATPIAVLCIVFVVLLNQVFIPNYKYNNAMDLIEEENYLDAYMLLMEIGNKKDITEKAIEASNHLNIPIAGSYIHEVGLKSDGTVVVISINGGEECDVSDWTDIVAISAGECHTVGLKSDGTVVAVGDNSYSQCSVSEWTDIVAISAGYMHTVGLKSDGTVVVVGNNGDGRCNVSKWTDIVAISAGGEHTVGLKSDGTVVAVGCNDDGRCNVSKWTDIVAISAGGGHTVGLKSDGTVVAVGDNSYSQCGVSEWTDIVAISAGGGHTVGLKSDGTVVAVGYLYNTGERCDVSDWTDIVAISAGGSDTLGLKSDGTIISNSIVFEDMSDWTDIKMRQK